ncbi:anti-sigma factor family protein [Planctomicrobium sp. SH664]|uniref:anti-sigma factor family protein n=1 Tax=Planctomicrobium sp. SH664 TaxID=3448125 RepID=UPI003F5C5768
MKCRDAKHEIALHLGQDEVDSSAWEETRRHLATCEECRQHLRQLKQSMAALAQSTQTGTYETRGSLWPELAARLSQPRPPRSGWNRPGWMPIVSVAVAALLLVAAWPHSPETSHHPVEHGVGRQVAPPLSGWAGEARTSPPYSRVSREAREADQRVRSNKQSVQPVKNSIP